MSEQWRKSSRSTDTGGNCVEILVVQGTDARSK